MTDYLLAIAVGPVQGFIEAARRTRDLWSGSHLLSEISKAVARYLKNAGADLIFPNPGPNELDRNSSFSAVNLIWAHFLQPLTAEQVHSYAIEAGNAARKEWLDRAARAHEELAAYIDERRWDTQLTDVIEIYAAWLPLPSAAEYSTVRFQVARLLSGRKACRDFSRWAGHAKVPKSSLDGARESVWNREKIATMPKHMAARIRLNEGEQLDAVGVTKRLGQGARQFPSVSRIAADPWLRGLSPEDREQLTEICSQLTGKGLISLSETRYPQFSYFPYEGSAVYQMRHEEILTGENTSPEDLIPLKTLLRGLEKRYGVPNPYLAVLAADGDRMGEAISRLARIEDHKSLSRALTAFATSAGKIVSQYGGCLVYSGGDDVLALMPVDTAIECADHLRRNFREILSEFPDPTLSVGIGIGHFLESLEDLLHLARSAEKAAKHPDRNGLAISWATRNAEAVKLRRRWENGLHNRLLKLTELHLRNAFPGSAGYQLREMARHYQGWPAGHASLSSAMRADALRLLSRKSVDHTDPSVAAMRDLLGSVSTAMDLHDFAAELIMARRFAAVYRQSGRIPPQEVNPAA
ncbi:MAG: type III-B CRISPR-associated protein Cas10/Cmr2 [Bryobacterales bacterium]|nr:type III-B CRISPR-associated protein Cas10/Cmr2 [Bryobacterales bacterium]